MSEYTPTTEQIRDAFHLGAITAAGGEHNLDHAEALAMFDRWLVEVVREANAERDAARARIAKVAALHHLDPYSAGRQIEWCICEEAWPCSTARALAEGDEE